MYEGGPASGALETTKIGFSGRGAAYAPAAEKTERRRFTVAVCETAHTVADNTFEVSVTKPYTGFTFVPGQSIKFCFGGDTKGRSFTIVSAPSEWYLTFVFRGSDSELKKNLLRLQAGDSVSMLDAKGDCTYPEEPHVPVVMLAGGVGIAPFMSMLRHAGSAGVRDSRQFHILYANRTSGSVVYKKELDELARSGKVNMSVRYFITDPKEAEHLPPGAESGRFSEKHIRSFLKEEKPMPLFYAVGSREMVEEAQKVLQALDVPETHIRLKIFKGYEGLDGA